jgi:hypothetical protein
MRGSFHVPRFRARPDRRHLALGVEGGQHGMRPRARTAGDTGALEPAPHRLAPAAGDLGCAQPTQSLEPHAGARPV